MSTVMNCPNCGQTLKVIPLSGGGAGQHVGGWQSGRSFAMGSPPAGTEFSRETPVANMGTIEAGFKLPVLQSLLMAGVALLLTSLGAFRWGWHWTSPLIAAVIAFCLAAWLLLLQSRRLLSSRETVTGDPGAGEVGFSVELTEPLAERATDKMLFCHFVGVQPVHVVKFAQAAIDDRLTPEGTGLSRGKFGKVRTVCLARGLVTWRDPQYHAQGLDCSRGGRSAFQQIIEAVI